MPYFSGFGFFDEKELFKEYLLDSDYEVSGFSYGAIKAFEFVKNTNKRIDKLTLLSPAFFQEKDKRFKRVQLLNFKKDSLRYTENFLKNVLYPSKKDISNYIQDGSYEELEELLNFEWKEDELKELQKRGIDIEVHLGGLDKIIDPKIAYEFFKPYATVYYYKDKGHILCKI